MLFLFSFRPPVHPSLVVYYVIARSPRNLKRQRHAIDATLKKGRRRADVVRQIRLEVAGRERQRRVPAREEAVARALRVELRATGDVEDLAADGDLETAFLVDVLGELGLGEDPRSASARERHGQERYR